MNETILEGKTILVGVSGGIAAYKIVELVSNLTKQGAEVRVIMTQDAQEFVGTTTFKALSQHSVETKMYNPEEEDIKHIELSRLADIIIVGPATFNTIGKFANGLADDLLSAVVAATDAPVLLCPSMDHQMYDSTVNQWNLDRLRNAGFSVLKPEEGRLASGRKGRGRLPSPDKIFDEAVALLNERRALKGKRVLVTAGPTVEPIDPMRYISNRSSGKMGYCLADVAHRMGGDVLLVSGPTNLTPPSGVATIRVERAQELGEVVLEEFQDHDLVLMAAAVADWQPATSFNEKLKKERTEQLDLPLEQTKDILATLGKKKSDRHVLVGFAAESHDLEANAQNKLEEKNLNAIFANPIDKKTVGPGSELNEGQLLFRSGATVNFPPQEKRQLARSILQQITSRFFPQD